MLSQYKDLSLAIVRNAKPVLPNLFFALDWKGSFIGYLDQGLTSLRTDGSVKWQTNELQYQGATYPVSAMNLLLTDPKGNVLVGIQDQLLCLCDDGNVLWAMPSHMTKSVAKIMGKYVAFGGKYYTMTATGLSEETDPEIAASLSGKIVDHHGGYYKVDEKASTLTDVDLVSGKPEWEYTLNAAERAAGYNISPNFTQNLASDVQGNV
ncbi:hypothetical protein M5X11_37655 [Paenibacillus alginolyticus]|uniref:hypothetical protein n=1 Tax=Paenibacillus alginolyticus TaxID=59839 RepID=UPI00040373F9|nr:hypothetical protein [Paenibacillus alginolyticus]MCY9670552.1 hypothetical protein [Paenibacillus alginolyticus]